MRVDQATVSVNNCEVTHNKQAGIHLGFNAGLSASGNTISFNGAHGLGVFNGSSADLFANTISSNGTDSTAFFRQGAYLYHGHVQLRGGSITNNPSTGIVVVGSATIFDNAITGNGEGVYVAVGSSLQLNGATINNNNASGLVLDTNSTTQIGAGTTVQGNSGFGIALVLGSKLKLLTATDVTGNGGWGLYCADAESSVNDFGLLNGSVSPGCTGF
jgi:parallel beta-helix repeat protein